MQYSDFNVMYGEAIENVLSNEYIMKIYETIYDMYQIYDKLVKKEVGFDSDEEE